VIVSHGALGISFGFRGTATGGSFFVAWHVAHPST
jgi:hypothetical protein